MSVKREAIFITKNEVDKTSKEFILEYYDINFFYEYSGSHKAWTLLENVINNPNDENCTKLVDCICSLGSSRGDTDCVVLALEAPGSVISIIRDHMEDRIEPYYILDYIEEEHRFNVVHNDFEMVASQGVLVLERYDISESVLSKVMRPLSEELGYDLDFYIVSPIRNKHAYRQLQSIRNHPSKDLVDNFLEYCKYHMPHGDELKYVFVSHFDPQLNEIAELINLDVIKISITHEKQVGL